MTGGGWQRECGHQDVCFHFAALAHKPITINEWRHTENVEMGDAKDDESLRRKSLAAWVPAPV